MPPLDAKAPRAGDPVIANPNIIAAQPFERVVFPRTPARVVALGTTNVGQGMQLSVYNIETRKKIADFTTTKSRWDHFALSEDGSRIAGHSPFDKEIGVLTKDGPQTVDGLPQHTFGLFFEFTSTSQLFVTYHEITGGQKYALVDTAASRQTAAAEGPNEEGEIRAIGPDRKTYAGIVGRNVVIRRLSDLQPVRQIPVASRTPQGIFLLVPGARLLASTARTELAALVEDEPQVAPGVLDLQTGKTVCDHVFDKAS